VEELITGGLLPIPTVRALSEVLIVIDEDDTPHIRSVPERVSDRAATAS
jgi:hypothetical protein